MTIATLHWDTFEEWGGAHTDTVFPDFVCKSRGYAELERIAGSFALIFFIVMLKLGQDTGGPPETPTSAYRPCALRCHTLN
jgi:hypothetical protein